MVDVLPLIWFFIIGFGVLMYVLLDGFVLGIGILSWFAESETDRDIMMNSVAPVWDGNETWLVLGGASLFAAFPSVYAVMLSGLYLPLSFMLLALIFRGVAFEFRFKAADKRGWNIAFTGGSVLASFFQGVVLGSIVQGLDITDYRFSGGSMDWLSPFPLLTGVAVVAGYALLGSTWMLIKTEGPLQFRAFVWSRRLFLAVLGFLAIVSIWVPFLGPAYAERWFAWPNTLMLAPIPVFTAMVAVGALAAIKRQSEYMPFIFTLMLFGLGFIGLAVSIWPHLLPPTLTIWNAASPPETQGFLLIGMVVMLPFILFYTAYSYWVFRGKIAEDSGYH